MKAFTTDGREIECDAVEEGEHGAYLLDGDEPGHTGHDKCRPINLQSDRRGSRRNDRPNAGRGEVDSVGRRARGTRRVETPETERGERRARYRREGQASGGNAHRAASERHDEGGGRPSDRRHYDSRTVQQGRSSGNPRAGSQRGSHREKGIGSRRGNSTERDPRRE